MRRARGRLQRRQIICRGEREVAVALLAGDALTERGIGRLHLALTERTGGEKRHAETPRNRREFLDRIPILFRPSVSCNRKQHEPCFWPCFWPCFRLVDSFGAAQLDETR